MPYSGVADLPASVRGHLPAHAQEIYMKAFNNAWREYAEHKDREAVAHKFAGNEFGHTSGWPRNGEPHGWGEHKVAWAAVEKVYRKDDERWVPK